MPLRGIRKGNNGLFVRLNYRVQSLNKKWKEVPCLGNCLKAEMNIVQQLRCYIRKGICVGL
jgi:DNA polymerase II large subunit